MTEFYTEADFPLQPDRATAAFTQLMGNEHLGQV
jgi:hypothetical protein